MTLRVRGLRMACTFATMTAFGQSTREMNDLNWMEVRELVPTKIPTVLLPTGALEAHGVANNGADNTAPLAIAHAMAPRVNALIAPLMERDGVDTGYRPKTGAPNATTTGSRLRAVRPERGQLSRFLRRLFFTSRNRAT